MTEKPRTDVWVARHSDENFTGLLAGVDFFAGQGSGVNLEVAARLLSLGCTITPPEMLARVGDYLRERAEERDAANDSNVKIRQAAEVSNLKTKFRERR